MHAKMRSLTRSHAVNNAGFVHGVDRIGQIADSDIEAMFDTNVLGLISMTQLLVKGELTDILLDFLPDK